MVEIKWPGDFAAARNVSIQNARADWLMWLDADNAVAPVDVDRLRRRLPDHRRATAWCTEVVVPAGERLIQKRVFPRSPEVRFAGRVHEQLIHPNDFASLMTDVEIRHWGYQDRAAAREKGLRNLALLRVMAEEAPGDGYVAYQLGRTLFNLRRFEEAADSLARAAEDEGINPGLRGHGVILLARALDRLGRPDRAEARLKGLTRRRPDYGPGFYHLGRHLYTGRRYGEAAPNLLRFLDLGANDPVTGFNDAQMRASAALMLGRCREAAGDGGAARAAYQAAVEADPAMAEPYIALGRLALADGRPREARGHLEAGLRVSPRNRRARRMLEDMRESPLTPPSPLEG